MARPPHAREKVLDAFESLLITNGTASLDTTAKEAGVSKGGLLYHFASKQALEAALVERLLTLVVDDIEHMAAADEGIVAAFIRSSGETDSPLDRAIVAAGRLANGGSEVAAEGLREMRLRWRATLQPHVANETALNLVLLVADGVYFNQALEIGSVPELEDLDALLAMVQRAIQ